MNYFTFDTETIDINDKWIYDIGWVVHDENGTILYTDRYLVREIYDNPDLMARAHYQDRKAKYDSDPTIKKASFMEIINRLTYVMNEYQIDYVTAYNLIFDLHALYLTLKHIVYNDTRVPYMGLGKTEGFFDFLCKFNNKYIFCRPQLKEMCLYGYTVNTLLNNKDYIDFAISHNMLTEKGNIQTSVENAYAYITNDVDFKEEHCALEDALIEVELFKRCYKINPEYNTPTVMWPYKVVQAEAINIYGQNFLAGYKEQEAT